MSAQGAGRLFEIGTVTVTETGQVVVDISELESWMLRMASVLQEVGGGLMIQAEREQVGELAGEPIAITTRVMGRWKPFSPIVQAPAPADETAESVVAEA